jgi:hypothetical protein
MQYNLISNNNNNNKNKQHEIKDIN